MTFYVGQKVVCVDVRTPSPGANYGWALECDVPVVGAIYIVREVGRSIAGLPGLKFSEITWRGWWNGEFVEDHFYWADRFRPITERKTDISCFTSLLTPNSKERVGV